MNKVYLIGAGPGNQRLLTVYGQYILQKADVVIYDRLISPSILALCQGEMIDVGKRQGYHPYSQHEINQLLVSKAMQYEIVVRLKGGDPYLFGRGGEEVHYLQEHEIDFEIISGVPSAFSVLNYAGIPATHRNDTANLQLISAHRQNNMTIDWQSIANTGGTMIFFMGVGSLPMICKNLINAGSDPTTPMAVIENGTTALNRKIIGTIGDFPIEGIQSPALIVVGDVVLHESDLDWYQMMPLHHTRVVVTRAQAQASRLTNLLLEKGADVIEASAIHIEEENSNELALMLDSIEQFDYLVFTSENGVRAFMNALKKMQRDIRDIGSIKIAVIGKGTAYAVESFGLRVDLMPAEYNVISLGILLAEKNAKKIIAMRAKNASNEWNTILTSAGIKLTEIPIYRTEEVMHNTQWVIQWIEQSSEKVYVMLGSASCARSFFNSVGEKWMDKIYAICIGETTKNEVQQLGYMHYSVAKMATLEGMVEELEYVRRLEKG